VETADEVIRTVSIYRRVVVPLDGSKLAENALPHVKALIGGRESVVHLVSVISPVREFVISSFNHHEDRSASTYLQEVAGQLRPLASEVQVAVRHGRQADEILAFAKSVQADLIVMSSHGRSGIGQWIFGSVADRVLRAATCPVFLVRSEQSVERPSYRRIVVPLDGSEQAEQVIPFVGALVTADDTMVYLVSVLTAGVGDRTVALLTSYPPGLSLATTALHHARIQLNTYLRSVAAPLRRKGAVVHIVIKEGSPAEEVLDYAEEVNADLIGMTSHGFSNLKRWAYGNVAGRILQGAQSPVLLVRPTADSRTECA